MDTFRLPGGPPLISPVAGGRPNFRKPEQGKQVNKWISEWKNELMNEWLNEYMNEWMNEYMNEWKNE